MIATTIEQSKHLLELGLDPATADMVWMSNKWLYSIKDNILEGFPFSERDTIAWSLSALLEVMPAHIADEDERLTLAKYHRKDADGPCYVINYSNPLNGSFAFPKLAQDPLDAAYEMVCWLLENGYIKKGGDQ